MSSDDRDDWIDPVIEAYKPGVDETQIIGAGVGLPGPVPAPRHDRDGLEPHGERVERQLSGRRVIRGRARRGPGYCPVWG